MNETTLTFIVNNLVILSVLTIIVTALIYDLLSRSKVFRRIRAKRKAKKQFICTYANSNLIREIDLKNAVLKRRQLIECKRNKVII